MQPFWEWFVKLFPLVSKLRFSLKFEFIFAQSVAPNMITLLGLVGNGVGLLIMLSMDTTFSQELPVWVYLFGAFALFMYQTLDAIDGKQARRTGTSGPLG